MVCVTPKLFPRQPVGIHLLPGAALPMTPLATAINMQQHRVEVNCLLVCWEWEIHFTQVNKL